MTIAIQTSPENALSNLTDLVEEVRDEMDDDAFSLTRINRAVARAEAIFNRDLRVPRMETEVQISVTSEQTELPNDFLQLRQVYAEGSPDNPLTSMSPQTLRKTYRGRSGTVCAYAIENRRIVVAPVGEETITLLYYARIPALTDDNPSNWLIEEHPDIYLHQCLAILFEKTGDLVRAERNLAVATKLIEDANATGRKNRWGAGPLVPTGILQVRGSRV